jgi:hypothetical protein
MQVQNPVDPTLGFALICAGDQQRSELDTATATRVFGWVGLSNREKDL